MLDGITGPYTLVRTAGHLGQPAIALTDHGSLSGSVLFWDAIAWYNAAHAGRHPFDPTACARAGCHAVEDCRALELCPEKPGDPVAEAAHATLPPIKGILGLETYVADRGRFERTQGDWGHLVLLALDETGWRNLRELASLASIEGFYSRPRIDLDLLAALADSPLTGSGRLARDDCEPARWQRGESGRTRRPPRCTWALGQVLWKSCTEKAL